MPPAVVTGYTAAKMDSILANVIKAATVDGTTGHLIITKYDNSTADLGNVKGATGATGATGPAGTAGTWYSDTTPTALSGLDASWNDTATIVIPTATTVRKVMMWGQVSFVGLTTAVGTYRASIRDATAGGTPVTKTMGFWMNDNAGYIGYISLSCGPLTIAANAGATFKLSARKDGTGAAQGNTDGDPDITKFTALVTV